MSWPTDSEHGCLIYCAEDYRNRFLTGCAPNLPDGLATGWQIDFWQGSRSRYENDSVNHSVPDLQSHFEQDYRTYCLTLVKVIDSD